MPSALPDAPVTIRAATPEDLPGIAAIQAQSPEAAQWDPLGYECLVAFSGNELAGFLVFRQTAVTEFEVLNLAVRASLRRQGLARRMMQFMRERHPGEVYLEVRESNQTARKFYESIGFQQIGRRKDYYQNPVESGIVMKILSC